MREVITCTPHAIRANDHPFASAPAGTMRRRGICSGETRFESHREVGAAGLTHVKRRKNYKTGRDAVRHVVDLLVRVWISAKKPAEFHPPARAESEDDLVAVEYLRTSDTVAESKAPTTLSLLRDRLHTIGVDSRSGSVGRAVRHRVTVGMTCRGHTKPVLLM